MGLPQEIMKMSGGGEGLGSNVMNVAKYAGSFFVGGTVVLKSFKFVPKNHAGFPTIRENPERTWGRKKGQRYKRVGSGLHPVWPFVGSVRSISMMEQPLDLQGFSVMDKHGQKYICDAQVTWRVIQDEKPETQPVALTRAEYMKQLYYKMGHAFVAWNYRLNEGLAPPETSEQDQHLYNALFRVTEGKLDNRVAGLAATGINVAIRQLDDIGEAYVPGLVHKYTAEAYEEELRQYGVTLVDVNVRTLAPSEHQISGNSIIEAFGNRTDHLPPAAGAAAVLHIVSGE